MDTETLKKRYAQMARHLKVPKSLRGKPGELMKAAKKLATKTIQRVQSSRIRK